MVSPSPSRNIWNSCGGTQPFPFVNTESINAPCISLNIFLFIIPFLGLILHANLSLRTIFHTSFYYSFNWRLHLTFQFLGIIDLTTVTRFVINSFIVQFHRSLSYINKSGILGHILPFNFNISLISFLKNLQNFNIYSHSHHVSK